VKSVCLLFAVYVFALALYPCADKGTCTDDSTPRDLVVAIYNQGHGNEEQDVCSPLCICACCSAQVQLSSTTTPSSFIHWAPNTLIKTAYQENGYMATSYSIWQPPKA